METEILMDQYGFFPKDTDRTVIPGWYRWYLLSGKRLQFAIEDGPVEVVNLPIKHGGYFHSFVYVCKIFTSYFQASKFSIYVLRSAATFGSHTLGDMSPSTLALWDINMEYWWTIDG